jgi:galactokinase
MKDLLDRIHELRSEAGDRALLRAIHFIGDNERVVKQVQALENNDFNLFLDLVNESGNSSYKRLQNIYSPKNIREQGVALALALTENYLKEINTGACRVHGGGFAGTIQVFLPERTVGKYTELIQNVFGENSLHILKIRPSGTLHLNPDV